MVRIAAKKDSRASQGQDGLQAEVTAVAAQLFGSDAGFDDSDFRPEKAQAKLGQADRPQKPRDKVGKRDRDIAPGQQNGQASKRPNSKPDIRGRPDGHRAQEAAPRGRNWNTGVGPRPGEKVGKSLLGSDEPSLWYEAAAALPALSPSSTTLSSEQIEKRRVVAEQALDAEAAAFEQNLGRRGGQDFKWLQEVRRMGTVADKLAAMTLLLQESAVGNLRSLDEMLRWVNKRSGARAAIDALRELFVAALLPDRKLRFFEEQPLAAVPSNKDGQRRLLYYYVEDQIKRRYAAFVGMVEEASRDNLEFLKEKALKALAQLLIAKPEQEARLLAALVNKLGDTSRKLASKAGYLLRTVLDAHPSMKLVMAREVERFMFRPGLQERARYYSVIFLNQMPLSHNPAQGGSALAEKLVDIYFTLFKLILEGKLGHTSELLAAKEAKAANKGKKAEKKLAASKVTKEGSGPRTADQAAEVDARMLGALLAGVRRAYPYIGSERADPLAERHADALFRIVHMAPFGVAVQALALLFQLLSARSAISDRFYRALYELLLSAGVGHTNKTAMFLSLVFKAMQADVSTKRVCAFVKRLLQVALHQQPNFACGCLMLTSQLLQASTLLPHERRGLWNQISQGQEADDGTEHFVDAPDEDDGERQGATAAGDVSGSSKDPEASAQAAVQGAPQQSAGVGLPPRGGSQRTIGGYDMRKREPLYAGAERVPWWELVPLASHGHPSVAAMARALLAGAPVVYNGDPLWDLSLTAFLDSFIQKKPKAHAKGSSLMQPLRQMGAEPSLAALGSAAFNALAEADVAPDAAFFQKYQALKASRQDMGKKKRKRRGDDEDEDEEASSGGEVSDSDEAVDDFLDAEVSEDEEDGNTAYNYDDLAAAFNEDGDVSQTESEQRSGGGDPDDGAEAGSERTDSGSTGNEESDADSEDEGSGELDILTLPEASSDDDDDRSSGSESSSSSEGEWVMYKHPRDRGGTSSLQEEAPSARAKDQGISKRKELDVDAAMPKAKQKRQKGMDDSVFAPAEDYDHLTSAAVQQDKLPARRKAVTKKARGVHGMTTKKRRK